MNDPQDAGRRPPQRGAAAVADLDTELWVRFGTAIAAEHRLTPVPLAELGMVDRCSCGRRDADCEIRSLLRMFDLT